MHLGLIVDLSLRNYGMCVAERMKANPGVVKRVVLLVTPYKLGYDGLHPEWEMIWEGVKAGRDGLAGPSLGVAERLRAGRSRRPWRLSA